MITTLIILVHLFFATPGQAASHGDDAYLHHGEPSTVRQPLPVTLARLADDLGDRVRGMRNHILARPAVPRPGAQLHTRATVGSMKRLPGRLEDRLLVSSSSPRDIATPGYLLRTGDELAGRGVVLMPIQAGFDLHMSHRNRSRDGGELLVVVEISNPNHDMVEVWLGGAIHSSDQHRGRWGVFGGYGGPAAATAEGVLTRRERHGWSERVLYMRPGSKVRVVTHALPHGHELDGYFHIDAGAPVHLDVRAIDPSGRRRDDGVAGGWALGDGCHPAGVYHGGVWATEGDMLDIPRPGRGRAYALGAPARYGQAPRGVQTYGDACRQLEGSRGVLHELELPLYNPSSRPRVVQLLISAPDDGSWSTQDYRWVGPVMVNGWLQRVRLERTGHAEVLGAWVVYPGEVEIVQVGLLVPSSSTGPSALEIRTLH